MIQIRDNIFVKVYNNKKWTLFFLTLCFLAVRGILFFNLNIWAGGGGDDAVTRVYRVYSQAGALNILRLPLHHWLMSFFMRLHDDPMLMSKFSSLFFAFMVFLCFFYLVRVFFGRDTALLSSVLLAFNSMHAHLSVIPMTQSSYLCFLLASILLAVKYAEIRKPAFIYMSAFLLGLSCMIRYESWLLIPVLFFYMKFFYRVKTVRLFMFFAISSLLPFAWLLYQWKATGNPFTFAVPDIVLKWPELSLRSVSLADKIFYWPRIICNEFGYVVSFFLLYGVINAFRRNEKKLFLLLAVFFFLITFIGVLTNTVGMSKFYVINSLIFLFPFVFYGAFILLKKGRMRKYGITLLVIIGVFQGVFNMTCLMRNNKTDEGLIEIIDYLRKHRKSDNFLVPRTLFSKTLSVDTPADLLGLYLKIKEGGSAYIIENENSSYFNWESELIPDAKTDERIKLSVDEQLSNAFKGSEKPEFAVFSLKDSVLTLFEKKEFQEKHSFIAKEVIANENYKLYRIDYVKS